MDSERFYRKQVAFEADFKKRLVSMYRDYWKYLHRLSCVEISALTAYKNSSSNINSLLRVLSSNSEDSPSIDHLRINIKQELWDIDCSLTSMRRNAIKFIENVQAQISTLELLFKTSPRLENKMVVYRGSDLGKMAGYDVEKLKIGSIFGSAGFFSTSLKMSVGVMVAKVHGVLFKVILPKNTPYVLLPGSASIDYTKFAHLKEMFNQLTWDEVELVLNRRTLYKVLKIENIQITQPGYLNPAAFTRLKMYTIQYVGQGDPLKEQMSAEDVVNKISNVTLPLL